MQSLTVPTARNPSDHTPAEILSALRGKTGSRRWEFRYELYTSLGVEVEDLDCVESCTVAQDWLADIKRTARFKVRETGRIDYLSDQIKPVTRLLLPPYGPSDWVEWPQGMFLLTSPDREVSEAGTITREVEAYDRLQILADDLVDTRYSHAAGQLYTSAVVEHLGAIPRSITPSTLTLQVAREWEPGTSRLRIVNDLLDAINYESLSIDENGRAIVQPYRVPSTRTDEYTYADDADSLILPRARQGLDLFRVPNKWVLVVSEPDRPPLIGTYTNNDPGSPTSTIRRDRTITDFRTEQDAPNQATLTAKAQRLAFAASQVYEAIDFKTGLMPIHSGNDVYRLQFSPLALNARYVEQSWSMELRSGVPMTHRARRMVQV